MTKKSTRKPGQRLVRRQIILVAALLLVLTTWSPATSEMFDQSQVKAVFVYNLAKFISWPVQATDLQPGEAAHFTIGILGHDVFNLFLEQATRGETIDGRLICVKRYGSLAEIEKQPCQLLFVSAGQMPIWPQIREVARRHRIFTVSDAVGFGRRGGMANLITSARRIIIEVNIQEAKRNGFTISSKLLNLARIVGNGKEE
jgi:hypothetical protein